ncbi:MAG: CoA transferase, partial [Deltaproteobacteria bacterium]|nr:CoA transferase [Deltaproteobacteria bacterium]
IVAALAPRKRKAVHLDISMTDSMIYCGVGNILNDGRLGILTGDLGRYQIYESSDGKLVSLAALEDKFWFRFCDLVARPEWKEGPFPDARPEVKAALSLLFKSRTSEEWTQLGRDHDICLTPALALSFPCGRGGS